MWRGSGLNTVCFAVSVAAVGLRALKMHFALPQKCSIEKVSFPTSPCADTGLSAHVASLYPSCMVLLLEPYAITLRSMVL